MSRNKKIFDAKIVTGAEGGHFEIKNGRLFCDNVIDIYAFSIL